MKNAIVYRLAAPIGMNAVALDEAMAKDLHKEPGPHTYKASGFVPPFGDGGDLLESLRHDAFVFCVKSTRRDLSSGVIAEVTKRKVREIEDREERTLGKGERMRVKDSVVADLLPKAFFKHTLTPVLITPTMLIFDATSPARCDDVIFHLRAALGSLKTVPLTVNKPVVDAMTFWARTNVVYAPGAEFGIGDKILELVSQDETRMFTLRNVDVTDDEAVDLLTEHRVVSMQLVNPSMSVRINESLHLRSIKWDESIKDRVSEEVGEDDHHLTTSRASYLLMLTELEKAFDGLIEGLGGLPELIGDEQEEDFEAENVDPDLLDPMFSDVAIWVVEENQPYAAEIQKEFNIGFNRASRLVERMERNQIVSPMDEDGDRIVLLEADEIEEHLDGMIEAGDEEGGVV